MKRTEEHDIVVCGGGLAGLCAAVAASRLGQKVCLIQDRPVLGGNSSSEIRVTPHGAATFHAYGRETGIVEELLIEERAKNHRDITENGWTNSVWDMVLYDAVVRTPNLTLHLNTAVQSVVKSCAKHIDAVVGINVHSETEITVKGKVFIDCTGDAVVADRAGCAWRWGTESRDEFGELHAPMEASEATMGNSLNFRTVDMGHPVPFEPPRWAVTYDDPDFFYKQGRDPSDVRAGYWWIEIGMPWNTVYDNETIRYELTRRLYGVWDWIKNKDPRTMEKARNLALDSITQVPGKRESRRVMGQYLLTENDIQENRIFPDEIAFGGWFVDLHTPGGMLSKSSEPHNAGSYTDPEYAAKGYVAPYGIPLRSLLAVDVDNLMMAGRNISVTHAALGTVRVQLTTAIMGQAAGTAAAVSLERKIALSQMPTDGISLVQQQLLKDDCFLPNVKNQDPEDIALRASVSASSTRALQATCPDSLDGLRHSAPDERVRSIFAQWIPVGNDHIDSIALLISNTSDSDQDLRVRIVPAESIWDYRIRTNGEWLSSATISVQPGAEQWITWDCLIDVSRCKGSYVRLELEPSQHIKWHVAPSMVPGMPVARSISASWLLRHFTDRSMAIRLSPAQHVFEAVNVLSGVARPHKSTNIWLSDPQQSLPQHISLSWPLPISMRTVMITFDGNIERLYHTYRPFHRDERCVKSFRIEMLNDDGAWQCLARIKDNYQRRYVHQLDTPVTTSSIRVVCEETWGEKSAAIYEIRVYA